MIFVFDLDYTLYDKEHRKYEHDDTLFYSTFKRDGLLNTLLKQLPGKIYMFTNGNDDHAQDLIKKMRIKSIFKKNIVTRDTFGGMMKPDKRVYHLFMKKFNLQNMRPSDIYFFEDTTNNLRAAKHRSLGWSTVLIDPTLRRQPKCCDYKFSNIYRALDYFIRKAKRKRRR